MNGFNKPTALVIATWDSEHFSWMACGANFKTARKYALEKWNKEVPEGSRLETFEELDEKYGVELTRVYPGFGDRT